MSNERKVLYSPNPGAGWSTWNVDEDDPAVTRSMAEDPVLVSLVERGEHLEFGQIASPKFQARAQGLWMGTDADLYFGGVHNLRVATVRAPYEIVEHDGAERVVSFPAMTAEEHFQAFVEASCDALTVETSVTGWTLYPSGPCLVEGADFEFSPDGRLTGVHFWGSA